MECSSYILIAIVCLTTLSDFLQVLEDSEKNIDFQLQFKMLGDLKIFFIYLFF